VTVDKPKAKNALSNVTITMSGPADVWFAVGFNAKVMATSPYTIVVTPDLVMERKLANHQPGKALAQEITVLKNTVSDGVRTVVITRAAMVLNNDYFGFSVTSNGFDFISAIGFGPTFSYHKAHAVDHLKLLPSKKTDAACICAENPKPFGQAKGSLVYEDGTSVGFTNNCLPSPLGSILDDKNPTCDLRFYEGGLNACFDGWFLLDADQEIPWSDQPIEYELKFRLYFADFDPAYHKQPGILFWGLGSIIENDVPKSDEKDGLYITDGYYKFPRTPGQPKQKAMTIFSHFHVGAAIAMEVYKFDEKTGAKQLLCNNTAVPGQGRPDVPYDEEHYISIMYCHFSDNPEYGLEPMPEVTDATFYFRKIHNATYGHTGDMSITTIYTDNDYSVIQDHELETEEDRIRVNLLAGRTLLAPPGAENALAAPSGPRTE